MKNKNLSYFNDNLLVLMLELNGTVLFNYLRYSNWARERDAATEPDNNNCNYYNNNHNAPRLEVWPVPEERCEDVPVAAPDPVQGDQWDRAELRRVVGQRRRQAAQEAQQVPPEQVRHQKETVPRLLQPRSRPHHREQRLAFLTFLVTMILPTIPRCTEPGNSGKNVCIT